MVDRLMLAALQEHLQRPPCDIQLEGIADYADRIPVDRHVSSCEPLDYGPRLAAGLIAGSWAWVVSTSTSPSSESIVSFAPESFSMRALVDPLVPISTPTLSVGILTLWI